MPRHRQSPLHNFRGQHTVHHSSLLLITTSKTPNLNLIGFARFDPPMSESDLNSPLIPSPHQIITIQTSEPDSPEQLYSPHLHNDANSTTHTGFDNPFGFLGSGDFFVHGSTTVNPFKNHTERIIGVYEWVKIVICLPIALARLVLFAISLTIGYVATKLALLGWKDRQNPMPKWRSRVMLITRFCSRFILFSFG